MSIDRPAVLRTIRVYRETIADVCAHDPAMAARVYADDAAAIEELLELACREAGVERAAYEAALLADVALLDLQRLALKEIVTEPADPGPYAVISRESPAGTPANYHLHPWNGIHPPGGVGGSGEEPYWWWRWATLAI